MEIAPGIHRVEAPLGDRYVALYLLVGDEAALLVDTGVADSVPGTLLPYLDRIGLRPDRVRYALNTHSDFDHVGGNAALRKAAPGALVLCGEDDRRMINDVELMIGERYGEFAADHGFDDSDETKDFIRSVTETVPVDVGLRGGERIDLGGRVVEVLHTPGHSWGHLSVFDPTTSAVMIGDAVLGNGVLTAEGAPAFPPTYRYVDTYRTTIARLQALEPSLLLTAHYPVYRGAAAGEFLGESMAYADHVERTVRRLLEQAATPVTLLDLVERGRDALGPWHEEPASLLIYPLLGHLESLEQRGVVTRAAGGPHGRVQFALAR